MSKEEKHLQTKIRIFEDMLYDVRILVKQKRFKSN